jgi:hypothetical protein
LSSMGSYSLLERFGQQWLKSDARNRSEDTIPHYQGPTDLIIMSETKASARHIAPVPYEVNADGCTKKHEQRNSNGASPSCRTGWHDNGHKQEAAA